MKRARTKKVKPQGDAAEQRLIGKIRTILGPESIHWLGEDVEQLMSDLACSELFAQLPREEKQNRMQTCRTLLGILRAMHESRLFL